ncbi:MAG: hypothetical protein AB7U20_18340 [Planctomycetaceae bacterium]
MRSIRVTAAAFVLLMTAVGYRTWIQWHGPAQSVLTDEIRTSYCLEGSSLSRLRVRETQLADVQGRRWTEVQILGGDPVEGGLGALEAELFERVSRRIALDEVHQDQ